MKREEIKYLIYGLRKKLKITQRELGEFLGIPRRTIGFYEEKLVPDKERLKKLIKFTKERNYNLTTLIKHGKVDFRKPIKIERVKELNLKYSDELAELIGILLGDGCIQRNKILISFNKILDKDYVERRINKIIRSLLHLNIFTKFKSYENTGEIRVYSRSFIRFLENKCKWKYGNKIINQTTIPRWCFKNKRFLTLVIRGYFDTDGYLAIQGNSPVIRIRFSNKCKRLIEDMSNALDIVNIKYTLQRDKIGAELRIFSREEVLRFFSIVGSSNSRNINKFLQYQKKINPRLDIDKINFKEINLPFLWKKQNKEFKKYIKEDRNFLEYLKIKKTYNWMDITKILFNKEKEVAKALKMQRRSIIDWKNGVKKPSIEKIPLILGLIKKHKINLENYKNA